LQERIVLEGNWGIKQLLKPIVIVTAFALVYQALPLLGAGDALIILFFLISPYAIVWLVLKMLKLGTASDFTWNQKFYEVHPSVSNGDE
jgi:hypothetical protein